MKWLILFIFILIFNSASAQKKEYTQFVNPMIGTGGHGHTYPGASMPYGMVQLSPDTRLEGWDGCSGYHYSDSIIYGFSHTHLSGTGCSDYGDILLMPVVTDNKFKIFDNKEYSSKFSHSNEIASPGFYKVLLDKFNITAELTCTPRTGFHKYTFPKTSHATVLIDLKHRDEVIDASIVIVNDSTIKGMRRSKAWAVDQYIYFYIRFSKRFNQSGVALDDQLTKSKDAQGKNVKAYFDFDATDGKPVLVKVGISGVSEDGAMKNLDAESPGWNFESVKQKAKETWNKELSKIEIEGRDKDRQTVFYTALYHCMLNPNLYMDVDGSFRSSDNKVHNAKDWGSTDSKSPSPLGYSDEGMTGSKTPITNFTNYTVFSLWDTYRALHPLLSIIDQKRTTDFVNTFLVQYQYGKTLPVWELSGNETWCMIGYHSVPVIVDAWQKGIRGFDPMLALKAMKHSADTSLYGLDVYRKNGFLSNDFENESVSKTLEYGYDDWCIAQMAKSLGMQNDYVNYTRRAQSYKNVYDPATGFMRGKNNGMFHTPFDPAEVNNYFTEANSWQYSFYVPQDVDGLMMLHGGKKKFAEKLDSLFMTSSKLTGRDQSDISGLIGQYAHGNEPSHHIAYLYNYANYPWKTQAFVHYICDSLYHNAPDGLSGNEDCGQMSAWYVMSAMGFYEVCPGSNQYAIGAPQFDKVTIHLENGRKFIINANHQNSDQFFIKSSTLNDKPYDKFYLMHNDIMSGGSLNFTMCDLLNVNTAVPNSACPRTFINTNKIVPAPYIENANSVFRNKQTISFASVDTTCVFFYRLNNAPSFKVFEKPFEITESTEISFYADQNNGNEGVILSSKFLKIPDNRTIELKTKYDSQYTAGGNDALIDGIRGDANWRKGGWQGYWGKDVEAVIDLGKKQTLKKISIGCLQDIGAWVVYPSAIEIFVSDDGVTFKSIGGAGNNGPEVEGKPEFKNISMDINSNTRYIKVVAKNYGKLPAWHISAGADAWLFLDEIVVE